MELMLFTNNAQLARNAAAAGVDRIVIDLEKRHKRARQHGYHLEQNDHTLEDVGRIKKAVRIPVVCRINPIWDGSASEVDRALDSGADVLMLPMFSTFEEAAHFIDLVAGRARTNLLFETKSAVELAPSLRDLKFDEAYVGLNDLRLSYGRRFAYQFLTDGTVGNVRACLPDHPFGFGGITVLGKGTPLSSRLIIGELARLGSSQVIVRRAFKRDVIGQNMAVEVRRIKKFYRECLSRSVAQVEDDRKKLCVAVESIVRRLEDGSPSPSNFHVAVSGLSMDGEADQSGQTDFHTEG